MSDETPAACCKCGKAVDAPEPVTRLISAGSAGLSGGGHPDGPYCAACDDERCHLYALFCGSNDLGFCGCGCPEEAYTLVRDILGLAPFFDHYEAVRDLIGERAYYFVLYAIDQAGLIEHGGGIGGSWLTEKGKHYLPLMRRYGWDEIAESGFPHSSGDGSLDDECGPGCPHWEAITEQYRNDEIRRHAAEVARAGDWQVIPPHVWTELGGAGVSVLVKSKVWVKARPGVLSDGRS